jgi:DNA primase
VIPEELVEQISQQADIVAIIGEHVKLKKTGSAWRGPCPFHQGQRQLLGDAARWVHLLCVRREGQRLHLRAEAAGDELPRSGEVRRREERHRGAGVPAQARGPDPREPLWELHGDGERVLPADVVGRAGGGGRRARTSRIATFRARRPTRFGLGYAPRDRRRCGRISRALAMPTSATACWRACSCSARTSNELRPRFRDRLMFPILDQSGHTVGFGGRLLGPGEPKYLNSARVGDLLEGQVALQSRQRPQRDPPRGSRPRRRGVLRRTAPRGCRRRERRRADGHRARPRRRRTCWRASRSTPCCSTTQMARGRRRPSAPPMCCSAKGFEVRVVTLPDGEDPDTFVRSKGAPASSR